MEASRGLLGAMVQCAHGLRVRAASMAVRPQAEGVPGTGAVVGVIVAARVGRECWMNIRTPDRRQSSVPPPAPTTTLAPSRDPAMQLPTQVHPPAPFQGSNALSLHVDSPLTSTAQHS
jgi:hypothetical protein